MQEQPAFGTTKAAGVRFANHSPHLHYGSGAQCREDDKKAPVGIERSIEVSLAGAHKKTSER
jgi:hypothetical protein